jgi:anaerobic selenocysteine-containing dehydrogenase
MHLVPEDLDHEAPGGLYAFKPDPATAAFPIALISPATDRMISSTLGEMYADQVRLELSPEDARARSISDGDTVRVWNELGEVRCLASSTPSLPAGTALLPKGLWKHHTLSGTGANALAPDTLADLGGGACFNDARVQVERVRGDR